MYALAETLTALAEFPSEEDWFEFKTNWFEPHAIGEYISALSNAAALAGRPEGFLIWGIDDASHEAVGTDFAWHRNVKGEPLEHYLARQLSPSIAFRFEETNITGRRIVALVVPAARVAPTSFAGTRYHRIGSSKVNLARYPEREAALFRALSSGPATIDNTPATTQDLAFTRLFTYYAGRGIELRRETFATTLGLRTPDGDYNLLAQLLSDNSRIPMRVSIFRGTDKASPLFSVREFGNTCLLLTLSQVLEYSDVLNLIQADEHDRSLERIDVPLFDPDAFREAIVNAFVHNRWTTLEAPMISVFSDRIEILSRGGIGPNQTLDGFFAGTSVPVNRSLSDIFLQLHISERSGRGVPVIVNRYGREAFAFASESIAVTLPFTRVSAPAASPTTPAPSASPSQLNKTQLRVLEEIRNNPNITHIQLQAALALGKTAIQNAVSRLRKAGIIERIGSPKEGWWKVHGE